MLRWMMLFAALGALAACATAPTPEPTPLASATVELTATQRPSSTATASATPSPSPTATRTPSPTASATPSPTATATPVLPTPDAAARTRRLRLPILMYHYVEPWPADAGLIRRGLTVQPQDFAAQLDYLAGRGYVTVGLDELAAALALGQPLPERAVILTFDDGYRSLMDYAAPLMQARGYTGTVFVITELMDRGFPAYLTWDQARALAGQGWRIESHSKTHANLDGASHAKQVYEILGALETIAANIGVRPRFLCYPAGRYDALTLEVVQALDLWGAVTTRGGRVHTFADRFTWTRVRVDGQGTLRDFITALEGDLQ